MIEITTTNGQFYYDLFYLLAIFFTGVFFMLDGKRKGYPLLEWALIYSSGVVFLIAGSKLFTYTFLDWKEILNTGVFPYTERNTVLGGIVGGMIGIWIAKKLTRFPHPVLDSFAVSFPIAMAIQRIGCLMVGCCYGTPTDMPWGISYSCHSMPYFMHLNSGLVNDASCTSALVHPSQLYQTVLCLFIAFVVWKFKDLWKRPGNLLFSSITLYCVARFILEFWRDGASNGPAGTEWMGLKYVQWGLMAAIILMSLFIWIRERNFNPETKAATPLVNPVWYFILLCVFVLIARSWFSKTEFLFIELVLIPTILLLIQKVFREHAGEGMYRLATVYSLLIVFVLSGSVTAQMSYQELTKEKASKNYFNDVSFGFGNFNYVHYHAAPLAQQGCYGPSYVPVGPQFRHSSNVFGAGISHIETYGKFQKLTIAGELSAGWDTDKSSDPRNTILIADIAPSIKFDFRWFGFGLGAHAGSNVREEYLGAIHYSTNDQAPDHFALSGSVRLFPYDIIYTQLRINEMYPYQIGHRSKQAFQILLGTGFGLKDGSGLEIGVDGNAGSFASAKALIKNKYGIKATLYHSNFPDVDQMMQFSVSYRFGQKHLK